MLNKLIENPKYLDEIKKFQFQITRIKDNTVKEHLEKLLKQLEHHLKILDEAHKPANAGIIKPTLLASKREIVNNLREQIKQICKQNIIN